MSQNISRMPTKERLSETIAFRVTPAIYQFLESLGKRERRKMSEIATALLERGMAAYARDRQLFEPDGQTRRVPVVNHAHETPARRKTSGELKKTGAGNR